MPGGDKSLDARMRSLRMAREGLRPTSRFRLFGVTRKMLDDAYDQEVETIEAAHGRPLDPESDAALADRGAVLSIQDAARAASAYREAGLRVVFTNGCFDLLHRGHVAYLREAKSQGDVLFVGMNSDASVRELKGPSRPVLGLADRVAVLADLKSVDHVVVFEGRTAEDLVAAIEPDVYVKGGDYRRDYPPPEVAVVERLGGEFRVLSYVEGVSTTSVVQKIRQSTEVP